MKKINIVLVIMIIMASIVTVVGLSTDPTRNFVGFVCQRDGINMNSLNITGAYNMSSDYMTVAYNLTAKTGRSASIVVAANDSPTVAKEQADYVCPAVDALAYINDTILPALPSAFFELHLLEGTYTVSTNNESLKFDSLNNFSLTGAGPGTYMNLSSDVFSNVIEVTDCSDVSISGLNINGNTTSPSGVWWYHQAGIYVNNTNGISIENCIVRNCAKNGISTAYLTDASITNNRCSANQHDGICIYYSENVNIANNICDGNQYGICNGYNNFELVSSNIAHNNSYHGIQMDHTDNSVVSFNIARSNNRTGIYCGYMDNTTLKANTLVDNGREGIRTGQTHNCIMSGNGIIRSGRDGINIGTSTNNLISANSIITASTSSNTTYHGISVSSSDSNTISNNIFNRGNDTDMGYCISISGNSNILRDNELSNSGWLGELSDSGSETIIMHNTGYITEHSGSSSSVQNATQIAHECDATPTYVNIIPGVVDRSAGVGTINATHFEVLLTNSSTGVAIESNEKAWWYAEAR